MTTRNRRTDGLKSLTVRGFKSIKAVEDLAFGDINIIIGPNGAGKSNLIDVFRFLDRITQREMQLAVAQAGGLDQLLHFGPSMTRQLDILLRSESLAWSGSFRATDLGRLVFAEEQIEYQGNWQKIESAGLPESINFFRQGEGIQFNWALVGWQIFHFHDTAQNGRLRMDADIDNADGLASDGANLPARLNGLRSAEPHAFTEIESMTRRVAPFFGSFVLEPNIRNPRLIRLRWRHRGNDQIFDVSTLSDGTLRFVALATALLDPKALPTLIFDEPELGLHPAALNLFAELVKSVSPRSQIIIATQSATLVDEFDWQDIIVTDRIDESSQFRRPQESEVATWLDDYSLGQIWLKNLIGGRPA